ncbi:MAG: glycosyltransferase family 2 protein [Syntrophaceae bacterium]
MPETPHVSVITPVFCTAETLHELYRRLRQVLENRGVTYEIIFVDDASLDDSYRILDTISRADPHVVLKALKQNVGQHRAIFAGLSCCRGEWAIVMDADLQDPPEVIPALLSKAQEGYNAVFAARQGIHESYFRLLTSRIFKGFLHALCGLHPNTGTLVALNRSMIDHLLSMHGPSPYLPGMVHCTGLSITSIPAARDKRQTGRSSYSFLGRIRLAWRALSWVAAWKWQKLSLRVPSHKKTDI